MVSAGSGTAFELKPFPGTVGSILEDISIVGDVALRATAFHFDFKIKGSLPSVQGLHGRFHNPSRKHEIWKSTCLEAFISPAGQTQYLEVNASPQGDWNLYHFADYRQNMSVVQETPHLSMRFRELDHETYTQYFQVDMRYVPQFKPLMTQATKYRIGVSAVIESIEGSLSYWALSHAGQQPDFHLRKSFILEI